MGMTYNIRALNREAVKLFADKVASKFTSKELEDCSVFFKFPNYEPYAITLKWEWDRYDFIYSLLESKDVEKFGDEVLSKASVLFKDCYIEFFNHDGVCHAIEKLKNLIKFDDDHGNGIELQKEVEKIYGDNRAYKYDQNSCKELIDVLNKIKDIMEEPKKDGTADVYWMIYAY